MTRILALAALLFTAPLALAADDPLAGLWTARVTFGKPLQGALTIRWTPKEWRGSIAGIDATSPRSGNAIELVFAGRGRFRGAASPDGKTIDGMWLQPQAGTEDHRDPGGPGQPFASPVRFRRAGAGVWRGEVRPLEETFVVWLKIWRGSDGRLLAAFRNPGMNSNGGATQFRVEPSGDAIVFAAGEQLRLPATLLRDPEHIRMMWPDLQQTIDFTRTDDANAAAFFPRPPGSAPVTYRRPADAGDGWTTARASDVGLDESALAKLVQSIAASDPAARRPQLIHSLLVARHGKLVLDEYFFGFDRETPHDTRSAAKTYASVLLGAAMLRGAKLTPQSRIYEVASARGPFANPDPRKNEITLAHLMTHTSGLACNDNDNDSPGNEGTMQNQTRQPDWYKYTLDLPMAHDPGTRYAYCSANMNLVGAALTAATGMPVYELFDRTVARRLQFGRYYWNLTPANDGYLGGGAFLRPRDFLKIGQAYLDGGVWHGKRIVPAAWVGESTSPKVTVDEKTTGLDAATFGNFYGHGQDGYAWHLNTVAGADGRTWRTYDANGNGGQILIVVPELDLAVVFTAGNYMQGGIWGRWRDEIVGKQIIGAITSRP